MSGSASVGDGAPLRLPAYGPFRASGALRGLVRCGSCRCDEPRLLQGFSSGAVRGAFISG